MHNQVCYWDNHNDQGFIDDLMDKSAGQDGLFDENKEEEEDDSNQV